MSLNAAAIEILLSKGLTGEDLLDVARALEKTRDNTNAERQARYRSRRRMGDTEWYPLRETVFERDGYACTYCGSTENLACDHIVPLIQGGSNDLDNLTTACRSCNSSKSGRTPEEWVGA